MMEVCSEVKLSSDQSDPPTYRVVKIMRQVVTQQGEAINYTPREEVIYEGKSYGEATSAQDAARNSMVEG